MILRNLTLAFILPIILYCDDNSDLGTIAITATKLTDSQFDSVSSVDVIDSEKLKDFKINSIEDISKVISNTNISGIGNRSDRTFSFRGISNYAAYESSVAMYIDNVPIPMSYGYGAFDMNDVDFLEILKGPQGTLFGKNAQSGVINIFTKQPTSTLQREVLVDISQNNSKNLYTRVSGPVKDTKLSYAFSLTSDTSDGFSKNTVTNSPFDKRDLKSFSSKLLYKTDDSSDIKLNYTKIQIDDGGSAFKINTKSDPFNISNEPSNDYTKMNNDLLSLVFTKQYLNTKFSSTTSYAKQDMQKNDYVGILGGLILDHDIKIEELSQEFRVNHYEDKYDILAGLFFSKKLKFDYDEKQELQTFNLASTNNISNKDENQAIFLQGRYWINSNYTLSLGGRYQEIKRDFSRDLTLFNTTNKKGSDTTTWNYFTPMASINYHDNSGYDLYLTYTQGYRSGGYNYRQESSALTPFKEETTKSYELGYKNKFDKYSIENVLFCNDIEDLRINTFDNNLASHTLNAQKAYSYGAELKINYAYNDFDIYSNLGIIKAKIKQYDSDKTLESKNLMDVPQATATLGAKYKFDKNYFIQSNLNYMGERYYNQDNSKSLKAYNTTDLEVGYENKSTAISTYVNNMFDKEYSDFMIATPSNDYYHFGKPRVFGIKFNKKF